MTQILPESFLKCLSKKDRESLGKAGLTAAEAANKGQTRLERELQSEIVQYLHLHGITVLWFRTDKRTRATIGWVDLTFCKDGVPWGIEAKTDAGRVRAEQYETMRKMTVDGWQCAIVRSFKEFHNLVFKGL
jgi:hypothetical protein